MRDHRVCPHCGGHQVLQWEVTPRHGQAMVWHCLMCADREYVAVRFESARAWGLVAPQYPHSAPPGDRGSQRHTGPYRRHSKKGTTRA